jgi:hypothetical protein
MKNYLAVVVFQSCLGTIQGDKEGIQTYIIEASDEDEAREIVYSMIGVEPSPRLEDYDDEDEYDQAVEEFVEENEGTSVDIFETTNNGISF